MPEQRDLVYKSTKTGDLCLDVLPPDSATAAVPALVWIGGGGWQEMGRQGGDRLCGWVRQHGYALVPIDYRVAPAGRHPACIQDVKAAIRWLRQRAGELGLDGDRLAVCGDSAGGHLALLAAATAGHAPFLDGAVAPDVEDAVACAVAYMPPCDLTRHTWPMRSGVEALLGQAPQQDPALARAASPLHHVLARPERQPPQLLVHGEQDRLVPLVQSRLHVDALIAAGVPTGLEVIPGAGHDSERLYGDALGRRRVLGFLRRYLPAATDTAGTAPAPGVAATAAPSDAP